MMKNILMNMVLQKMMDMTGKVGDEKKGILFEGKCRIQKNHMTKNKECGGKRLVNIARTFNLLD